MTEVEKLHLPEPPLTGVMTEKDRAAAMKRYGVVARGINAEMKAQRAPPIHPSLARLAK